MRRTSLKHIRLNTSSSKILFDDKYIDFTECSTADNINEKIKNEALDFCRRKSTTHEYCLSRLKRGETKLCFLQVHFLRSYLTHSVGFIQKDNPTHVKSYIEYLLSLTKLVSLFSFWRDSILNATTADWLGEMLVKNDGFWLNKTNVELAKSLELHRFVSPNERNYYKYKIFVEGPSDQRAIYEIGLKIGQYIYFEGIEVIKGVGNIKNSLSLIDKYKNENKDIFFLIDQNREWEQKIKKKLVNPKKVNKKNIFQFKKSLEDAYPINIQFLAFSELKIPNSERINKAFFQRNIDTDIVNKIHKELLKDKIDFKNKYKEEFNKLLLKNSC